MRTPHFLFIASAILVACSDEATAPKTQREVNALVLPGPLRLGFYVVATLPIPVGYTQAEPFAINDSAVIVGTAYTADSVPRPARWTNGTVQLLALPRGFNAGYAQDINGAGLAVGAARLDTTWFPVTYGPAGATTLNTTGYVGGWAHGINDAGEIVGHVVTASSAPHPARWSATGVLTVHTATTGWMRAINASGDAAGMRRVGTIDQPSVWKADGTMLSLPAPSVAGGVAQDLANDGTAVILGGNHAGWSAAPYGAFTATWLGSVFEISNKGRMVGRQQGVAPVTMLASAAAPTPLPLNNGATLGVAYAVNTCGTVVGFTASAAGVRQPVRWSRQFCDP